ncbi:tetratricopeptide repeat-containing sensor histidine kinase [Arsenicibacter rosenii]|uniref:Histidine kinase domain-containing protein n=1 Tax=Arsenicibacter rosenii TaxID=1750698 RepID=A0A1S2VNH1_9BACT|nr:histidine kinase [Arsenicibacter rosenii]OIN59338.1 hypothetical protein BLX24_10175 [Arsenicibacter rosenii]
MRALFFGCIGSFVVAFSLSLSTAMGQAAQQLDSLANRLSGRVYDSAYVDTQNRYSWQLLQHSGFKRADSVFRETERLANRIDYPAGLHQMYYNRALSLYYQDQSAKALAHVQKARALEQAYPNRIPVQHRPMLLSLTGVLYFANHAYAQSLHYYLAAIKLAEQRHITYRITPAYLGVGNVLKVMNKPDQALSYYQKALDVSRLEPEPRMRVLAENHMGDALSESARPDFPKALIHYLNALPVAERYGVRGPLSDVLTNIGRVHLVLGHYQQALRFLKRSEVICRKDSLSDQLGAVYWIAGQAYQALRHYPLAEKNLLNALQIARQIGDADETRKRMQTLAGFYQKSGRYELAYRYEHQTALLNDSLFNVQAARHTQELTTKYETAQKESQLKLLRAESAQARLRTSAILIGAILLMLLAGAVTAYLLNRARLRRLEEAQRLRQQIARDLHDEVGSTLSSISLLSGHTDKLLSENRPEMAQRMVQKIYTDARQILESIDEIIWTINPGNDSLQRIMQRLREYAQPLMESKNIRFTFDTDQLPESLPIPMDVRRNLYMIGKEAINNLVKYADATEATVRFEKQTNQLVVRIEDNGKGFDTEAVSIRNGQQSMKRRAEEMDGQLIITSRAGHGTALQLTVGLASTL